MLGMDFSDNLETEELEFHLDQNYDYVSNWVKPINYVAGNATIYMNDEVWAIQNYSTLFWLKAKQDADFSLEENDKEIVLKVHDPGVFDWDATFKISYRCFTQS